MERSFNEELPSELQWVLKRLRGRILDIMGSALEQGELPSGKQIARRIEYQLDINVIPGVPGATCHKMLLLICSGRDSLERRLREGIDHIGNRCPGINKWILIPTDKWRPDHWFPHKASFQALSRAYGIQVFRAMLDDPALTPIRLI
jgi:hypothetical protein